MNDFDIKALFFASLIEQHQIQRLRDKKLDCQANIDNSRVILKGGNKYVKVDIGTCGRFMVEKSTGNIFGIKAYGQIHRGHQYGNLDTVSEWNWGDYYPQPVMVAVTDLPV